MKETIVGVGILLLFVGIVILPMSLQVTKTNESKRVTSREFLVYPDWTLSAQFNESEDLVVYFSAPRGEIVPEPSDERYMFVDIVDPRDSNTTFNLTFTKTSFEVRLGQDGGGLLLDLPSVPGPADIGGRTMYDGEYTVCVRMLAGNLAGLYYPNSSTMRRLEIYKVTERIDYPHVWLLPVALSLAAIGSISVVWGTRSQKRRAQPRKLRKG